MPPEDNFTISSTELEVQYKCDSGYLFRDKSMSSTKCVNIEEAAEDRTDCKLLKAVWRSTENVVCEKGTVYFIHC